MEVSCPIHTRVCLEGFIQAGPVGENAGRLCLLVLSAGRGSWSSFIMICIIPSERILQLQGQNMKGKAGQVREPLIMTGSPGHGIRQNGFRCPHQRGKRTRQRWFWPARSPSPCPQHEGGGPLSRDCRLPQGDSWKAEKGGYYY